MPGHFQTSYASSKIESSLFSYCKLSLRVCEKILDDKAGDQRTGPCFDMNVLCLVDTVEAKEIRGMNGAIATRIATLIAAYCEKEPAP